MIPQDTIDLAIEMLLICGSLDGQAALGAVIDDYPCVQETVDAHRFACLARERTCDLIVARASQFPSYWSQCLEAAQLLIEGWRPDPRRA